MVIKGLPWLAATLALMAATACGAGSDQPANPQPRPAQMGPRGGPTVVLEPSSGPPGTEIAVTGSGWPARAQVVLSAASDPGRPYLTLTATEDGSLAGRFRLERTPSGGQLPVGRFDLVARYAATEVPILFLVEVARPVRGFGGGS